MRKEYKVVLAVAIFIISFITFSLLEFEILNQASNTYFQSLIFSFTLIISIFKQEYRTRLFYTAFFLVTVTVGLYLINQLALSNAAASMGVGMLLIIAFSYLPTIVKNGYVEKL